MSNPKTRNPVRWQANTELGLHLERKASDAKTAADIPYTPANPADWADPPPTTLAEALDRRAAHNTGA